MVADAPVAAAAASVPGIAEDKANQRGIHEHGRRLASVLRRRAQPGESRGGGEAARATPEEAEETLAAFRDVQGVAAPPISTAPPARTSARGITAEQDRRRRRELPRTRGVSGRGRSDAAIQKRETRKTRFARAAAETRRLKGSVARRQRRRRARGGAGRVATRRNGSSSSRAADPARGGVQERAAGGVHVPHPAVRQRRQVEALAKTGGALVRGGITARSARSTGWIRRSRGAHVHPEISCPTSARSARGRTTTGPLVDARCETEEE